MCFWRIRHKEEKSNGLVFSHCVMHGSDCVFMTLRATPCMVPNKYLRYSHHFQHKLLDISKISDVTPVCRECFAFVAGRNGLQQSCDFIFWEFTGSFGLPIWRQNCCFNLSEPRELQPVRHFQEKKGSRKSFMSAGYGSFSLGKHHPEDCSCLLPEGNSNSSKPGKGNCHM